MVNGKKYGFLIISIPTIMSVLTVIKVSVLMLIIYILVHFLVLKIFPECRRYENFWMFIMVAVSTIPINVFLIRYMLYFDMIFSINTITMILNSFVIYAALLSVEEIAMGVVTRLFWKEQDTIEL